MEQRLSQKRNAAEALKGEEVRTGCNTSERNNRQGSDSQHRGSFHCSCAQSNRTRTYEQKPSSELDFVRMPEQQKRQTQKRNEAEVDGDELHGH
jgi:hypothetical protein